MKWLKRIFDFYLDASVHAALGVYSLLRITALLYELELNEPLIFFVFFSTVACYNFIKYGVEAEKFILVYNKYHKNIQFFSFIGLAISGYYLFFLKLESWVVLGILVVLTGFYALPVLPQAKNFRSLGGLKIFMVALVWAGVTVVLPFSENGRSMVWDDAVVLAQRILIVLILLIPFEIRDLAYDKPELKTIPQRFGVDKTRLFGGIMTLVFFLLTFLKDSITKVELLSNSILFVGFILLMLLTKRQQSRYFSSFWVEAIPIAWLGIVWILKNGI